ncbi:MAG: hypothetical protein ABR573_01065 [Candidatus Dormibacteria bacterium]
MRRFSQPLSGAAPWPTVLGLVVSVTAVALGLRFGLAGLAGTIAIGLFALFVSAAIVSTRRPAPGQAPSAVAGNDPATPQPQPNR